jgi:hypothetical protein
MLCSHLFKVGSYSFLFKFQSMKKLDVRVEGGVSARIPDTSLFVTFLDYDNIDDKRLIEELQFLQDEFQIGNFIVLETRNKGRHAICIDALRFKDVIEIIRFSSCDLMFKKAPMINEYRTWVLRYAKKGNRDPPKYLYTVKSHYEGQNYQSQGHAQYLQNFGVKIDLKQPYGSEEVETQDYNTGSRTGTKKQNGNGEA